MKHSDHRWHEIELLDWNLWNLWNLWKEENTDNCLFDDSGAQSQPSYEFTIVELVPFLQKGLMNLVVIGRQWGHFLKAVIEGMPHSSHCRVRWPFFRLCKGDLIKHCSTRTPFKKKSTCRPFVWRASYNVSLNKLHRRSWNKLTAFCRLFFPMKCWIHFFHLFFFFLIKGKKNNSG